MVFAVPVRAYHTNTLYSTRSTKVFHALAFVFSTRYVRNRACAVVSRSRAAASAAAVCLSKLLLLLLLRLLLLLLLLLAAAAALHCMPATPGVLHIIQQQDLPRTFFISNALHSTPLGSTVALARLRLPY